MTLKLSDHELEQLLRGEPREKLRPPADLLARLRADLPAELPGDLPAPEKRRDDSPGRVLPFWRRPVFALAASLTVLLGGSFLALRTFETTTKSPEVQAQMVRDAGVPAEPKAAAAPAASEARVRVPAPEEEQLKIEAATAVPAPALGELSRQAPARIPSASATASPQLIPPAEPVPASEIPAASLTEKKVAMDEAPAKTRALSLETSTAPAAPAPLATEVALGSSHQNEENDSAAPTAPPLLEKPGIEGNALAEKEALRDLREEPLLDRLESPTHQGDALRRSGPAPPAPAASLQRDRERSEGEERWASSWRAIERSLAEGRWPNEREIEDARAPLLNPALPKNKTSTDADGENEPKDPVLRLMMDLLNALGRKELSLGDLHAMRLRAVKLAELRPEDTRVATVLRTLNLAGRLLSD